jgi:hypothetical protein
MNFLRYYYFLQNGNLVEHTNNNVYCFARRMNKLITDPNPKNYVAHLNRIYPKNSFIEVQKSCVMKVLTSEDIMNMEKKELDILWPLPFPNLN